MEPSENIIKTYNKGGKMMVNGNIMMKILITDAGEIIVADEKDKPIPAATAEELGNSIHGKTMKAAAQVAILASNPCGWVWHNNNWYWRCIG